MKVLMLDIGGSRVKLMQSRDGEVRDIPSGPALTPEEMMAQVHPLIADWRYDAVSIGFPSVFRDGRPVREPINLGPGWMDYDLATAFPQPVRMINDAAMQALGNYTTGRLLFLGFGTSIGTCLIADDTIVPVEIGLLKFSRDQRFIDRLAKKALERDGEEAWLKAVHEAVALLQDVFCPDQTVLGGGNTKIIDPLPEKCRAVDNNSAYLGALRLWEDADLFATSAQSTWKIRRRG